VTFSLYEEGNPEDVLDEATVTLKKYGGRIVVYNGKSPVELNVETPSGKTVSPDDYDAGTTVYNEFDVDESGDDDAQVVIASPKYGSYNVEVVPTDDAGPTDTYTLEAVEGSEVTTLAKEVPVSDIPADPYSHVAGRPSTIAFDVDQDFDGADEAEDYRLVALPGAVNRPLGNVIEGKAGIDWQAFWDDGSANNFLVEYDESNTFTLRPGKGFWLTSRQPWTTDDSLDVVPLGGDQIASIFLHEGWNIISNPLRKDVPWSRARKVNSGTLQPIWAFNSSFTQVDTLRSATSGRAYYFLNDQGLDSLAIPLPNAVLSMEGQTNTGQLTSDAGNQAVEERAAIKLIAQVEDSLRSTVQVGIDPDAVSGLGPRDVVAPPSRFSAISLWLKPTGDQPARRRRLASEWRPPVSRAGKDGHTFSIQLQTEISNSVEFSTEGLSGLNRRDVALLHPSTGRSYDLNGKEAITLQKADSTALRLAVGSAAYVQDQAEKVIPDEVTLTSYPNPTSGQATLEYTLPEAKEVRLTVYDVLGRQVAVLDQGRKQAGRHEARLDGTGLSSGVYFGRLRVGDKTRTQKITVVR
jgi:hypothetical protein